MSDAEKLFNDNINLAYSFAKRYYSKYGFEDAVQISLLGFWKACLTYNKDKGISLSTYSYVVMQNEFNILARKDKKNPNCISIEETVKDNLVIGDFLSSDIDCEELVLDNIEKEEITKEIYRCMSNVEGRDKEIFRMHLKGIKQMQIAKELGISQAQVSRVISKLYDKIKHNFRNGEII